jgi:hypothetical protein
MTINLKMYLAVKIIAIQIETTTTFHMGALHTVTAQMHHTAEVMTNLTKPMRVM